MGGVIVLFGQEIIVTPKSQTRHTMYTSSSLALAVAISLLFGIVLPTIANDAPKKAAVEAPKDPALLVGKYRRGDGLGYNVTFTLNPDGSYTSDWHGCLGKYGDASGNWTLKGGSVHFTPTKKEGLMKGHLKELEVMKVDESWILVPTEKKAREFYDKWGISSCACFQKSKPQQ